MWKLKFYLPLLLITQVYSNYDANNLNLKDVSELLSDLDISNDDINHFPKRSVFINPNNDYMQNNPRPFRIKKRRKLQRESKYRDSPEMFKSRKYERESLISQRKSIPKSKSNNQRNLRKYQPEEIKDVLDPGIGKPQYIKNPNRMKDYNEVNDKYKEDVYSKREELKRKQEQSEQRQLNNLHRQKEQLMILRQAKAAEIRRQQLLQQQLVLEQQKLLEQNNLEQHRAIQRQIAIEQQQAIAQQLALEQQKTLVHQRALEQQQAIAQQQALEQQSRFNVVRQQAMEQEQANQDQYIQQQAIDQQRLLQVQQQEHVLQLQGAEQQRALEQQQIVQMYQPLLVQNQQRQVFQSSYQPQEQNRQIIFQKQNRNIDNYQQIVG